MSSSPQSTSPLQSSTSSPSSSSSSSPTRLDLVVFGATGFTGRCVVPRVRAAASAEGLTWGVAGRDEHKLRKVLQEETGSPSSAQVIVCDVADQDSLVAMARKARVVLNCVGPYRFFGEQVVRACIAGAAHHLDISGEPQFLERMQLAYDTEAANAGVYVIGSCGFDSIPADLGQVVIQREMGGDVNSVETFLKVTTPPEAKGPFINFATWQSAIHGFAHEDELKPLRRKLFPEPLPPLKPKLERKSLLHFNTFVDSYCAHFPGADRSVMMRTQRARFQKDKKRPAQIGCYFQVSSILYLLLLMLVGGIFALLARCGSYGRYLLERYPGFFSCGLVGKEGPPKETAENTNFIMTLVGHGWNSFTAAPEENHPDPPNRRVVVTASGRNVGYGATCDYLVQSALTILKESEQLPGDGGVLTPGYAFANTSLVERCNKNGVPFVAKVTDI